MVLAGLHACGDLSVTMLRTFLDSDKVKAVISIGCCYNLLSEEEGTKGVSSLCGFPMSKGVKSAGFALGRNACDLACECAERWRSLAKVAGPNNFEMHGFRAAFQMVLSRYYPEILLKRPRLGRQGKALRRQQHWRFLKNNLNHENSGNTSVSLSQKTYKDEGSWFPIACPKNQTVEGKVIQCDDDASYCESSNENSIYGAASSVDEYPQFIKFCQSGLGHLGLHHSQDIDFRGVWEETKPFAGLIGPYWSIRAALGPILETLLLLDRLLFLQEHGKDVEAVMLPIFNPILSPRNVALIAKKT